MKNIILLICFMFVSGIGFAADIVCNDPPQNNCCVDSLQEAWCLTFTVSTSSGGSSSSSSSSSSSGGLDGTLSQIAASSTWQRYIAQTELSLDYRADAYSGGGVYDGVIHVFGGGHNNGMSDGVARLDLREFSTVGWTEPFQSTAEYLGVGDDNYAAIGAELNTNYINNGLFSRGELTGRLSVHTYDGVVSSANGFYLVAGENPYDNPGQPGRAWPERDGVISYFNGQDWQHVYSGLDDGDAGRVSAELNSDNQDIIYIVQNWTLYEYSISNNTLIENPSVSPWNYSEGWALYCGGQLHTGGGYNSGGLWSGGTLPFNDPRTGSVTCANNEIYAYESGTMWVFTGSGWSVAATGGPDEWTYTYGRFGYDEVHNLFFVVAVVGFEWQTWFVRL